MYVCVYTYVHIYIYKTHIKKKNRRVLHFTLLGILSKFSWYLLEYL